MTVSVGDRARVPFALVGVIVLVASTGVAVTLNAASTPTDQATTTTAVRETAAAARTALHGAVRRAGARAAQNPVLTPANTSYGRVLDPNHSVRSAFRVRIAVAARDALETIGDSQGEVRTAAELQPIDSPTDLRAALANISLTHRNNTASTVTVTLSNVRIHAAHDGRTRATESINVSVTVDTPVLAFRHRVNQFERHLNRSPFTAGFGRQVTARLYAMAWARGYAQYGGAPIENVVANRHLEVATNGALLAVQREFFGAADAAGERAHHHARLQTGVRDLVTAADISLGDWADSVLNHRSIDTPDPGPLTDTLPDAASTLSLGLDRTADDAFSAFVDGNDTSTLSAVIDDVFTATANTTASTTTVNHTTNPATEPPGWTLQRTTTTNETSVRPASLPPIRDGNRTETIDTYARFVTVETTTTKTWRRGRQTKTTTGVERVTYAVRLAVHARLTHTETAPGAVAAPQRTTVIDTVADSITRQLITDRGGPSTLATRAVNHTLDTSPTTFSLPVTDSVTDEIYHSVATLRTTLRNLTVPTDPADITAGPVTETIKDAIDAGHHTTPNASTLYPSLAAKARAAANQTYLATVRDTLDAHGTDRTTVLDGFADLLTGNSIPASHLGSISDFLDGSTDHDATASTSIQVAGVPAYLTRTQVTNETSPGIDRAYYPLATRNVNLVTVPYSDVSRAVTDAVIEKGTNASVDTAARALRIANQTLEHVENSSVRTPQHRLRTLLRKRLNDLRSTVGHRLADTTAVTEPNVSAAINHTLDRWKTVHDRVLAVVNGSVAAAVLDRVAARTDLSNRSQDRVGVNLRREIRSWLPDHALPKQVVARVADAAKGVARRVLDRTVESVIDRGEQVMPDRWMGRAVTAARGGIPLIPVPGYWYATANAWNVELRGAYARFAVAASANSPLNGMAETVEYVREDAAVRFDVDGDGTPERFGRNERIRFGVDTAVIIVVPPGRGGIADVDGVRDERSPGWNNSTTTK